MSQIVNERVLRSLNINQRLPVLKLDLVDKLIQALNSNNINYCHWKSSEHLDASMVGDTDLDILFDINHKDQLETILGELGIKRFEPAKQRKYADIEDYIGLDFPSGKIIHIHSHYKLTLGEINLKSYQLNLEDKVLNSRVYDEMFDIYRIHPAFELTLLYFRQALKIRNRDKIKIFLTGKVKFSKHILKEYEWLKKRCNEQEMDSILRTLFTDDHHLVLKLVSGDFNRTESIKLAGLLKEKFKSYRLYSQFHALLLRWYREIYLKGFRKYARLVNKPMVLQRVNPRGGLVIAVIGADGSGKSTVIANLKSTFGKKLDVYSIYFGSGAGKVSWPRKLLTGLRTLITNKGKKKEVSEGVRIASPKQKGLISKLFKGIISLIVAYEKRANLKLMLSAKKKGMLVICDRYPQSQINGYNDGPLLQHFAKSGNYLLRSIANREANIYRLFNKTTPDLIFKLIARAEVVEARKPGQTDLEILRAKIEGVKQLKFPDNCKVITINAEEPIDKVLFAIKKKIWESYE